MLAGITGLDQGADAAGFFRRQMADVFGIAQTNARAWNDMAIAYRAACTPGTGILVYSGTGSIACHVTAAGELIRVGGYGVIIDDAGSGFWIAKEALKALFRAEDRAPGSGWSTPLGRALAVEFGGATWDHARAFVYGGDRGRVASLAPAVARAASDGDNAALSVIESRGRRTRLARGGVAVAPRPAGGGHRRRRRVDPPSTDVGLRRASAARHVTPACTARSRAGSCNRSITRVTLAYPHAMRRAPRGPAARVSFNAKTPIDQPVIPT